MKIKTEPEYNNFYFFNFHKYLILNGLSKVSEWIIYGVLDQYKLLINFVIS